MVVSQHWKIDFEIQAPHWLQAVKKIRVLKVKRAMVESHQDSAEVVKAGREG